MRRMALALRPLVRPAGFFSTTISKALTYPTLKMKKIVPDSVRLLHTEEKKYHSIGDMKIVPLAKSSDCIKKSSSFPDGVSNLKIVAKIPVIGLTSMVPIICLAHYADIVLEHNFPVIAFFIGLTYGISIDRYYNNTYHDIGAIKKNNFEQSDFDELIRTNIPSVNFNKSGNCFGHVAAWSRLTINGIDYFKELSSISRLLKSCQELSTSQLSLLQDIGEVQKNNKISENFPFFRARAAFYFHTNRQKIVKLAIAYSNKHPEELTAIVIVKGEGERSHIIGILTDQDGLIRYFDPNHGEFLFSDAASAEISLSRLLAYEYRFSYLNSFFKEGEVKKELRQLIQPKIQL